MLLMGVLQKCPFGLRRHNIWPPCPSADPHLGVLHTGKRVLQQALIRPGCGIHVVWSGTGGSGVTGVRFAYPARALQPQADRKFGTDGAVVADALFRVRATP